jgi:guanylate kinase
MTESEAACEASPLLIVLSGPSGVGKDAVLSRMRELKTPYHFTVTATTRERRPGEREGVDYIFVAEHCFHQMIADGRLLEWAEVYGHYYGVPREQVASALDAGRDVIVKADVQGAATIREMAPEALSIFLAPPSDDELRKRLNARMTESAEALTLRLETAKAEMEQASRFDRIVVNHSGRLDDAVREIEEIVAAEKRRVPPRRVSL